MASSVAFEQDDGLNNLACSSAEIFGYARGYLENLAINCADLRLFLHL